MFYIRKLWFAIRQLWRKLLRHFFRQEKGPKPLSTAKVDEVPETVEPDLIYLVGENEHYWYVVMQCPCGCNELIHLSLLEGRRPKWTLTIHEDDTISLHPSVWRKVGCKAHFFLESGFIRHV